MLALFFSATLTAVLWFLVLISLDPNRREKGSARPLLSSFFWGMLSIVVVSVLYALVPDLSAGIRNERIAELADEILVVGPVEEFSKFIVFFIICQRRRPVVQEPLDAMLHAAMVALAFSIVENFTYGLDYSAELTVVRAFLSTPGHLSYAAIWGFAYSVFIHANPARRMRDYVVLFLFIYPAALIHGLSNFLLNFTLMLGIIFDAGITVGSLSLLILLHRVSPFRPLRLRDAARALPRIETSLRAARNSFSLNLRSAFARAALKDYRGARARIDRCLSLRRDDPFCRTLSGALHVLEGRTEEGVEALAASYGKLSTRQKLSIRRLTRHITTRPVRGSNLVNEFLLGRWILELDRVKPRGIRGPSAKADSP